MDRRPPSETLSPALIPFASMAGGWLGWALYLTVGNVAVNLYPVLLQRYTRARLTSILNGGLPTAPR